MVVRKSRPTPWSGSYHANKNKDKSINHRSRLAQWCSSIVKTLSKHARACTCLTSQQMHGCSDAKLVSCFVVTTRPFYSFFTINCTGLQKWQPLEHFEVPLLQVDCRKRQLICNNNMSPCTWLGYIKKKEGTSVLSALYRATIEPSCWFAWVNSCVMAPYVSYTRAVKEPPSREARVHT